MSLELSTILVVAVGVGLSAFGWAVYRYLREKKRQMPLNPSNRKPASVRNDMVSINAFERHHFCEQHLSTEEKIRCVRTQLRLDTENTVNIAVCGNSGSGKSTFINCIRGIPDVPMTDNFVHDRDGSAPVGIIETTSKTMPYWWRYQNCETYVTLWDLPAAGTISNSDVNYFEEVGLYAFDYILLLRSGRFTEFDVAICQQALKYKIPIVLVISKGDQDVSSRKKIRTRQLRRQLTTDEYEAVISETKSILKENALAELTSIHGTDGSKLHEIPMFVIAAQSYRDQLNHMLDGRRDCPPLEMENLLEYSQRVVLAHRQTKSGN